jgi:hypothetical protein
MGGGMNKKFAANAAADSAIRYLHHHYYERDSWAFQGVVVPEGALEEFS